MTILLDLPAEMWVLIYRQGALEAQDRRRFRNCCRALRRHISPHMTRFNATDVLNADDMVTRLAMFPGRRIRHLSIRADPALLASMRGLMEWHAHAATARARTRDVHGLELIVGGVANLPPSDDELLLVFPFFAENVTHLCIRNALTITWESRTAVRNASSLVRTVSGGQPWRNLTHLRLDIVTAERSPELRDVFRDLARLPRLCSLDLCATEPALFAFRDLSALTRLTRFTHLASNHLLAGPEVSSSSLASMRLGHLDTRLFRRFPALREVSATELAVHSESDGAAGAAVVPGCRVALRGDDVDGVVGLRGGNNGVMRMLATWKDQGVLDVGEDVDMLKIAADPPSSVEGAGAARRVVLSHTEDVDAMVRVFPRLSLLGHDSGLELSADVVVRILRTASPCLRVLWFFVYDDGTSSCWRAIMDAAVHRPPPFKLSLRLQAGVRATLGGSLAQMWKECSGAAACVVQSRSGFCHGGLDMDLRFVYTYT